MSLTRERTVWCDGEDCGSWAQSVEPAKVLRRDLRRQGWTRVDGKDICPACNEKIPTTFPSETRAYLAFEARLEKEHTHG